MTEGKELVKFDPGGRVLVEGDWWALTTRGLRILGDPKEVTWAQGYSLAKHLGQIGAVYFFAVGDFMRFAEWRWGEKYAQLAELFPNVAPGRLANIQWVASRIDPKLRREDVTDFEKFAAVAPMVPELQAKWLDRVARDDLDRQQLRDRIAVEGKGEPIDQDFALVRRILVRVRRELGEALNVAQPYLVLRESLMAVDAMLADLEGSMEKHK